MTPSDRATVLVVDDDRDVADAYAAQLSDRYDVQAVYRGSTALETLDEGVDVVLLDRRMPDLSGSDVLERIRERGLDTQVAMVTAVDPDFDIIDMPFDDYVVKPVSQADLFDTIERLLTCAAYEDHVQEFYALTTKYAALQANKTNAELEESEEFRALERQLDHHREALDRIVRTFDESYYQVVLGDIGGPNEGEFAAE